MWLEVRDGWCWGCTNSYQYGLGGKVGRLVGCHKGGVGQVTSRQGMRCAARRHQHLLCFITLHKERNIQQSLPAETGLGRAEGINTTWRRDVFYQQPGGPENGKASTDPTHCPDGPRPWARPIGLQSTALSHLYTPIHTYAHTERRRLGLVQACIAHPSRHGPAACSSGAGLVSRLLEGCATGLGGGRRLSDCRAV